MEAFADAVGLRMPGLGTYDRYPPVSDKDCTHSPACRCTCTPVCELTSKSHAASKNGSTLSLSISAAVKAFLTVIQFGKGYFADEGLLVNPACYTR